MKNVQKGFTLIELMIVVAIIAILAAIAIPQYQTYVVRSQVSRVMGEAGDMKVVVEDCLNNGATGQITTTPNATVPSCVLTASSSDLMNGGLPVVNAAAANSTIVATFGNHANAALGTTNTLTWTRNSSGSWTCTSTAPTKYRPASC
ncbi:pilin [Dyella halodurans]|uniref:Pilin n=1 Tax=Dyella halodurans TaxID=1920171 RepID=A0ABV9C6H6_9GAMM|nr:pilin [Dyella halodurans]